MGIREAYRIFPVAIGLGLNPFSAQAGNKSDNRGCRENLGALEAVAFPTQAWPLPLLENAVEVAVFNNRIQFSRRGSAVTFVFGSGGIIRVHGNGELEGRPANADAAAPESVLRTSLSPTVASGLIRYAYWHCYTDQLRAFNRTLRFLLAEAPEFFSYAWKGLTTGSSPPNRFDPGRDLNQ